MRTLTSCLTAAVLLSACSSAPEPGVDVFTADGVSAEPAFTSDSFVEEAVTLDSCELTAPGVVDVAGSIDLGQTGLTDDGPIAAELVVEVGLGGTVVAGTITGELERFGSFTASYPLEQLHGAEAAGVVESRIGAEDLTAVCRAELRTRRVRFEPAGDVPLVAAEGVEPREGP